MGLAARDGVQEKERVVGFGVKSGVFLMMWLWHESRDLLVHQRYCWIQILKVDSTLNKP